MSAGSRPAGTLVLVAALAIGCGDATAPDPGLAGHFEWRNPFFPVYIGVTLSTQGGSVSGTGTAGYLSGGVIVEGTYTPPEVRLTMRRAPWNNTRGVSWLEFEGTYENGVMSGTLFARIPHDPGTTLVVPAELRRTDTVPVGRSILTVERDGETRVEEGEASFSYFLTWVGPDRMVRLRLSPLRVDQTSAVGPGFEVNVGWNGLVAPAPGSYLRDASGYPFHHLTLQEHTNPGLAAQGYAVVTARIDLDVVRRFGMLGRLEIEATEVESGMPVRITGTFGASCLGSLC